MGITCCLPRSEHWKCGGGRIHDNSIKVRAFRTYHAIPGQVRFFLLQLCVVLLIDLSESIALFGGNVSQAMSVGLCGVYTVKQKLKQEYLGLPGSEIKRLKLSGVEVCLH
jgi:hypothetical protein